MEEIREIKTFQLKFKPITVIKKEKVRRRQTGSRRRTRTVKTRPVKETVATATTHLADFAKIFHSSLIDTEVLARPTIISESRKESALKYTGLWASNKVNINTAPRQVLEATFVFGGSAEEIAEEIIMRRRIEPFKDMDELKRVLFRYSDSIEKCKDYITMVSDFFTIRVTAISGVAEASAIIAIRKDGRKVERIAIISS
jgi:DNA uptake protein ComE-like DNA-binding protein